MGKQGNETNGKPSWATECQWYGCEEKQYRRGYCSLHAFRRRNDGASLSSERRYKVRVVSCPDNFYPRGALLPKSSFFGLTSRKVAIDTGFWIPGMVIETTDGERYRVEGKQMEPQKLVRVEREYE